MTLPGYTENDARFLALMLDRFDTFKQFGDKPWTDDPYVQDARRIFRNMIDRKINFRAGLHKPRGRKDTPEYAAKMLALFLRGPN